MSYLIQSKKCVCHLVKPIYFLPKMIFQPVLEKNVCGTYYKGDISHLLLNYNFIC